MTPDMDERPAAPTVFAISKETAKNHFFAVKNGACPALDFDPAKEMSPVGLTITDQLRHRQTASNNRSTHSRRLVVPVDQGHSGQFLRSMRTRRYGRPLCGTTTERERRKLLQVPANWKTVNPTKP
jgi:hypothetical protein